ncbi:MAG: hypothetical protein WCA39_11190 [Nitrososphaeraceae archaeon]
MAFIESWPNGRYSIIEEGLGKHYNNDTPISHYGWVPQCIGSGCISGFENNGY